MLLARENPWRRLLVGALLDGTLADLLSALVLAWRGRIEVGRAAAALNAPGHWVFGRKALREDEPSTRYTLTGALVHHVSSVFWGVIYAWVRGQRRRPTKANAVVDAAAVTAVAATVDLVLVPERLTPGFERRLSPASVVLVYCAFAAGLALGGAMLTRR